MMQYHVHVVTVAQQRGVYLGIAEMELRTAEGLKSLIPNLSLTPIDLVTEVDEEND